MYGRIVIVGAGQAAAQAADTLRRNGYAEQLCLVGEEPSLPYQRPPLSKKYLAGALEHERLLLRPARFYGENRVDVRLGRRVEEIARREQQLCLDDGTKVSYDAMLLATGSRPKPLGVSGADLDGVYSLRTIADVGLIRADLLPGRRLVIVGGGYIGLEVAATARALGVEVTVLEMGERVMSRVVCPQVSAFYTGEHIRCGVRLRLNETVRALIPRPGSKRVGAVVTAGEAHPADLVVVGCGASPADELARAAGLTCENGVVVDEHCRTSDPAIYAAGDCTNHPNLRYGLRLRLESVDNAFEQGASAALNLLGRGAVHDKVPWFWSDQYDLKLIIVGISQGYDSVVLRGDPRRRAFSACYLRGGELIAIDSINSHKDQMGARKLIAARARPDLDRLANPDVLLRDCA